MQHETQDRNNDLDSDSEGMGDVSDIEHVSDDEDVSGVEYIENDEWEEEEEESEEEIPESNQNLSKEDRYYQQFQEAEWKMNHEQFNYETAYITENCGPQVIPDSINEATEAEIFQYFFTGMVFKLMVTLSETLWLHLTENTNIYIQKYIEKKNILRRQKNKKEFPIIQISKQDVINYWSIFWSMGLIKFGKKRKYWESQDKYKGLTGNKFVSNTMSYHKWILIDRCMQADLN